MTPADHIAVLRNLNTVPAGVSYLRSLPDAERGAVVAAILARNSAPGGVDLETEYPEDRPHWHDPDGYGTPEYKLMPDERTP